MRIAVLAGGISAERDVSLLSGEMICTALRKSGHETAFVDSFLGADVEEKDIPSLYTTGDLETHHEIADRLPDLAALRAQRGGEGDIGPNVVEILRYADITFNALHGGDGENGRMQAYLDMLALPYTGDGYLASALAMHKGIAKLLFEQAGVPVPPGICLRNGASAQSWKGGFPCIVKPVSSGSSVGVAKADSLTALEGALTDTFAHGDEALVERFIPGREFAVGVLGGRALPVIEITPDGGAYDYAHKYQSGLTVETCPALLPADTTVHLQEMAERACTALGIEIVGRGEFILDPEGNLWCLEMNTLPGMTPLSLLPQEAAAAGLSYGELCMQIIDLSRKKYDAG